MLWNSVYEFFIKYVFGGYYDNNNYSAFLGSFITGNNEEYNEARFNTGDLFFKVGYGFNWESESFGDVYLSIGNYFSLIATIITMVIIVTLCALFIWKMVKLIGGLIR